MSLKNLLVNLTELAMTILLKVGYMHDAWQSMMIKTILHEPTNNAYQSFLLRNNRKTKYNKYFLTAGSLPPRITGLLYNDKVVASFE